MNKESELFDPLQIIPCLRYGNMQSDFDSPQCLFWRFASIHGLDDTPSEKDVTQCRAPTTKLLLLFEKNALFQCQKKYPFFENKRFHCVHFTKIVPSPIRQPEGLRIINLATRRLTFEPLREGERRRKKRKFFSSLM